MGTPDVSVVIPTYRRPGPLAEAIASALAQAPVTVEVIVMDDSPEGSGRAVVEAVGDSRVRYQRQTESSDRHPAVPRNAGLRLATGRYVHFLDDDDRVVPGGYLRMEEALDRHATAGAAMGGIEPFGEDPATLARERRYFRGARHRAQLCAAMHSRALLAANLLFRPALLVNSACLIRRDCALALGGYDPRLPLMEDGEFYLRAIRRFGWVFVPDAFIQYRTGAPSLMAGAAAGRQLAESYRLIYAKYRQEHGALELRALQLVAKALFWWA